MRKIFILFSLTMVLLSSIAFAENKLADRWFWVFSNSSMTQYVDKETISYDPAMDTVTVWVYTNQPNKGTYTMSKAYVYYKNNTLLFKDNTVYKNDNPIDTFQSNEPIEIPPNTSGEAIKKACASLVDRNTKLKEYQDEQAKAQAQKEQEEQDKINQQKEAQEKAKQKIKHQQTVNTAIGIIGGLIR